MVIKSFAVSCVAAILFTLVACGGGSHQGGGGGGSKPPKYATTSLTITVGSPAAGLQTMSAGMRPLVFLGTFADVAAVTVVVSGQDEFGVFQNTLATAILTLSGGVWSATIPDLPVGPPLTFTAHGYDASSVEIFSGVTTQVLTGSGDNVSVAMTPLDDGTPIAFPIVANVTRPAAIVAGATALVQVGVTGSPFSTLSYSFTSGGGTFLPDTGTLPLPGAGTGTIASLYTAPAAPATYAHSVRVTNSQGNAVETDFSTTVVYGATAPDLEVSFAPAISALLGKRTGNTVAWTATVSDDGPPGALSYAWSFAQVGGTAGSAFSSANANPGIQSGYDQTVTGTVQLTVTDGDGLSTTITFTLVLGQFPDSIVGAGPSLPLLVSSASGTLVSMDGVWAVCRLMPGGPDRKERYDVSGSSIMLRFFDYASTDGTCSAGEVPAGQVDLVAYKVSDFVAVGWAATRAGDALAPAPQRTDGAGPLPATPLITAMTLIPTSLPEFGAVFATAFVDDSAVPWRVYGQPEGDLAACPPLPSGHATCVRIPEYLVHNASGVDPNAAPAAPVVAVIGGIVHSVALRSDGTLWAWGSGELGDGTAMPRLSPVQVGTDDDWSAVSRYNYHTLALKTDGTLWAWGENGFGQLGNGGTTPQLFPSQVGTGSNWTEVATGAYHSLAIKSDGTLWAWGRNNFGQLGEGTIHDRLIPVRVGTDSNWTAVAAGGFYSFAIKSNGTLWAWGINAQGQLGDGTTATRANPAQVGSATNWLAVGGGSNHTVALKSDGTLWAWGDNVHGELGDGTTVERHSPVQVGTGTDWTAVAVGYDHALALKSDSTLWSWGLNSSGQLGDGSTIERYSPVQVGTASDWTQVAAGGAHSVALRVGGTLWLWGENGWGQLGDGTTTSRSNPVQLFLP